MNATRRAPPWRTRSLALLLLVAFALRVADGYDKDGFCTNTADCINEIRRRLLATNFWFGDAWRRMCLDLTARQREVGEWASGCLLWRVFMRTIGARLLQFLCSRAPFKRVNQFYEARDSRFSPQIISAKCDSLLQSARFGAVSQPRRAIISRSHDHRRLLCQLENLSTHNLQVARRQAARANLRNVKLAYLGAYRGCDHDFLVKPLQPTIVAHPASEPIEPFLTRDAPTISWPLESQTDATFIVAMIDVGFGQLKYLAVDYTRSPRVLRAYEPIDNFRRSSPTPLVVLVFRDVGNLSTSLLLAAFDQRDDDARWSKFDLSAFMLEYQLDDSQSAAASGVARIEAKCCRFDWCKLGDDRRRRICDGATAASRVN